MKYLLLYRESDDLDSETHAQIENLSPKQYELRMHSEGFDADSNLVAIIPMKEVKRASEIAN